MKSLVVLLALSAALVGCTSKNMKRAQAFEVVLEAGTGTNWTVVKATTEVDGYSVFRNEATGEFVAYNVSKYDSSTMTTLDQYLAVASSVDVVGNLDESVVTSWSTDIDGNSYLETDYYYSGSGFRFNNTNNVARDLETFASLRDEQAVAFLAGRLKNEYSLSTNRAQEMARLASRYRRLESARELTTAEKNSFALSALGVNMNQVETAMRGRAVGMDQQYQELLRTAARVNGTTPEQIGKFFDQLAEAN